MSNNLRGPVAGCLFIVLLVGFLVFNSNTSKAYSPKKKPQENGLFVPGRVLVQFRPETLSLRSVDVIGELGARDTGEIAGTDVHIVELPVGADEVAFTHAFSSRQEVEFAELDRIVPPAEVTPNDPWYTNNEWHLRRISAPTAWSTSTGSSSVTIAILDTGVTAWHEDLVSKMVPGWNVYDNNNNSSDVNGHGTLVAGTAAAASNNATGVASVAWGCMIMPIRVSAPDGTAQYSAVANGLTWAADRGARVANVSYRMSTSSTVATAAQYFQSKGGVVTVAAGNEAVFDSSSDNPYVLTVSATDYYDALYSWSNTGNNVDVAAPGFVYTTAMDGGYSNAAGTSVAAPIVAGEAALVFSVNPSLTGAQAQDIIKQSADDLGSAGWDSSYGWGRVNVARALALAGGGGMSDNIAPTVSIPSPTVGSTVSGTILVQVNASDNVGVASVQLSVDGMNLGTDATAPFAFDLNTTGLNNGVHTITATANDVAGNIAGTSISVTVNNAGDSMPPVISITSPSNGAKLSGNVSVLVNAADNVAVARVELYVDGQLQSTSTAAPFTNKWNTKRVAAGAHTLQCKAYDAAGNAGTSAAITVYK